MRTRDVELVLRGTNQYSEDIKNFRPKEWLEDLRNIALTNKNEDVALFEYMKEGVVIGHYFFHSRGRKAIEAAKEFLREIFSDEYNVKMIIGLTPLLNKKAKWMNRHLGFKYHGIVKTEVEPCEIVIMIKEDWEGEEETTNG